MTTLRQRIQERNNNYNPGKNMNCGGNGCRQNTYKKKISISIDEELLNLFDERIEMKKGIYFRNKNQISRSREIEDMILDWVERF